MSGGLACAIVEPSVKVTIECTIDCGCTTTSMRSYGMPNSRCVSISSRPLLTSDAEFSVFIGPIDQVGCAPACSGVTCSRSAAAQPRNGPPEAVSTRLATSSAVPPRRHCASAECSESTGTIWPGFAARSTNGPPAISDSLFARANRAPLASAASVGCQAQGADQRIEHDVGFGVLHERRGGIRARVGDLTHLLGGSWIGDGDVGHAGFRALAGQQVGIAAAGGQAHHLEAVRVGGDHLQRLGADRTGAAQHQDAETVSCCAHCPIVRQPGPSPESLLPQSPMRAEMTQM